MVKSVMWDNSHGWDGTGWSHDMKVGFIIFFWDNSGQTGDRDWIWCFNFISELRLSDVDPMTSCSGLVYGMILVEVSCRYFGSYLNTTPLISLSPHPPFYERRI